MFLGKMLKSMEAENHSLRTEGFANTGDPKCFIKSHSQYAERILQLEGDVGQKSVVIQEMSTKLIEFETHTSTIRDKSTETSHPQIPNNKLKEKVNTLKDQYLKS